MPEALAAWETPWWSGSSTGWDVLSDLVQIADRLRAAGVYIELLQPRVVFDDSTMGKAMYAMFGMFAEMERDLIRERTRAGLAAARARGRAGGGKVHRGPDQRDQRDGGRRSPHRSNRRAVRCLANHNLQGSSYWAARAEAAELKTEGQTMDTNTKKGYDLINRRRKQWVNEEEVRHAWMKGA